MFKRLRLQLSLSRVSLFPVVLAVVALFGVVQARSTQPTTIRISGVVLSEDNKVLPNTTVTAEAANGTALDSDVTGADGTYSLNVPSGNSIRRVIYNNPAWHVRLVEELSGRPGDNNVINKLLLDRNGPESFELIVDQIMIYDRLRIFDEYSKAEAVDDAYLRQKERQLQAKYGDRVLRIPHPLRRRLQGPNQNAVIDGLTPAQRNVVNRLMGDLLFRYGYTQSPIYN